MDASYYLNLDGYLKLIDNNNYVVEDSIILFLDGGHFLEEENNFIRKYMKDLYKKNLDNINISEIQKFALDLGLSINTEHTEKDKPKSTLISD